MIPFKIQPPKNILPFSNIRRNPRDIKDKIKPEN